MLCMGIWNKLFGTWQELGAPVAGEVFACDEVNDPVFSQEMLGRGVAIRPSAGRVVAPCDATVDTMFETGHAVSLIAESGAELLIHVGVNTVNLKGRHYTVHAAAGDQVKKGQMLIEFDADAIAAEGYDTMTPFIVCNSGNFKRFETIVGKAVAEGETVIRLAE